MNEIKIQIADDSDVLEVRTKILRPGQWPKPEKYVQDRQTNTVHISATDGEQTVAVATFIVNASPDMIPIFDDEIVAIQLRGMAVLDSYRRRGIGADLLRFANRYLTELYPKGLIWFNAREAAIPFYTSLKFLAVGEFFAVPKIGPHKVMWKFLGEPL